MEYITSLRKDVKEKPKGVRKGEPRRNENQTPLTLCLFCFKPTLFFTEVWHEMVQIKYPMFPMIKEMSLESLKLLSFSSFREFKPLLLWRPLKYFRVISLSLEGS